MKHTPGTPAASALQVFPSRLRCDVQALLKAARWPEGTQPALLVGQQPTLALSASQLLTDLPQPWAIENGAAWWLRNRNREGLAQVVLQAVVASDSP
jgi:phosphohistidine phosphatase